MNPRVRAIIIVQNKILLIKRIKPNETYWVFPGGGVEPNETKKEALIREIKEELSLVIKVKELFLERPSDKPGMEGITEYFFKAEVIGGKLGNGDGPEHKNGNSYEGIHEINLIDINKLPKIELRPKEVKDLVIKSFE